GRLGATAFRLDHPSDHPDSADRHAGRVHAPVPDLAPRRHAQRDPAAAPAHHADTAGGRPLVTMDLGPHAAFIVIAYAAALGIVAALVIWVVLDRRQLKRTLDELDAHGVSRRSERPREEKP